MLADENVTCNKFEEVLPKRFVAFQDISPDIAGFFR